MANTDNPFGLRPVQAPCRVRPYYVPSGYGTALFIGDPVIKTGTSNTSAVDAPGAGHFPVGTMPAINKATAGDGNAVTGVIVGFAAQPNDLEAQYSKASTEGVAWVADYPAEEFYIQADGTISAAQVSLNANVIYTHSGDTTTGLSGVELDTTSDAPDADASNQLTIQRVANWVENEAGSDYTVVVVKINQHTEADNVVGL